jgi:hypothetical protein
MIALWILGLVAGLAWINGMGWLVGAMLIIILLALSGILSGLAGLSRRRSHKQKYHPVH